MKAIKTIITIVAIAITTLCAGAAAADPVGGSKTATGVLGAGRVWGYELPLRAGETTAIDVYGDGDGDIDCVLADENGNVVDQDLSGRDGCSLRVHPRWTATFTLVLRNAGDIASAYRVVAY